MVGKINVPESLEMTFKRVLRRVPEDKRNDAKIQESILLFLKLGGEKLARARIKPIANPFPDDIAIVKPRPQPASEEPAKPEKTEQKPETEKAGDPSEKQG